MWVIPSEVTTAPRTLSNAFGIATERLKSAAGPIAAHAPARARPGRRAVRRGRRPG